ncbi:MAG: acyltransferase [Marmoricola sp.]
MDWEFGGPPTPAHLERLLQRGADRAIVDGLVVREVLGPLPDWWPENGNALYAVPGAVLPYRLINKLVGFPCHDTLLVIATDVPNLSSLLVSGSGATVLLGPESEFTAGDIYCGADSSVIFDGGVTATREAVIDARNGGSIVARWEQLWAANVYVATDDMHRLESVETGVRLNPFGATIHLGRHLWLGRDVIITGHVEIGDDCVIGTRSMVRGQKIPANSAVAGVPARVIREGVTWTEDDLP